jgi:two-component system sensor histidine kinase BaeS
VYLFVHLPNQLGNGVTYAEYARRGFGELCVVVTIVGAVILFAEKLRRNSELTPAVAARRSNLRALEFGTLAAAFLLLLSALRRVILYEQAYGYTVARLHATAYIVFMAGFLILLTLQLRGGGVTPSLARRTAALGFVIILAILYWNDQAWIMNRNIDRIRETGKFDAKYAASLSDDALPTIAGRKNEIAPADWIALRDRLACKRLPAPDTWYQWNAARSSARAARASLQLPAPAPTCPTRSD